MYRYCGEITVIRRESREEAPREPRSLDPGIVSRGEQRSKASGLWPSSPSDSPQLECARAAAEPRSASNEPFYDGEAAGTLDERGERAADRSIYC
jgi:hypothetical protein